MTGRLAAPPHPAPARPVADTPALRRRYRLARLDIKASPYLFVSPYFLLFALFGLFPLGFTVWVSLHRW
ncbi:MAG: sugar ABC transporter permease, partial [Micromonosporaceae bacterium]